MISLEEGASIVREARGLGATLAGLTSVEALRRSPSYAIYHQSPYYDGYEGVTWPPEAKSVLVLALAQPEEEPGLDWWSEKIPGRTPGNGILMRISRELKEWLGSEMAINATPLAYSIENGGIFLKDAAALAGLGVMGRHNLFISPQYGSRLRLRGLFLDRGYEALPPVIPSPCAECDAPCHAACPEQAFQAGRYDVMRCEPEMRRNRENLVTVEGSLVGMEESCQVEQFCRACELACPVGTEDQASTSVPRRENRT
jgi:epoxyqueuosine reductase